MVDFYLFHFLSGGQVLVPRGPGVPTMGHGGDMWVHFLFFLQRL